MKKNYEKNQLVISISFIFIILCFIFLVHIFTYKYRSYKIIDSVLISENYLKLIITNKDLKTMKKSKYLFIDNKKSPMEITNIERNVLRRKVYYHEIIIRTKVPNKYHDGDYIKVTIYEEKKRMLHIFKSCWKE